MPRTSTLQLYEQQLWDDLDTIEGITVSQGDQLRRYRHIISVKQDSPSITNVELVKQLEAQFGIGQAQGYRDIRECEPYLARITTSQKNYIRYLVNETLKEAINLARDNKDPEAMTRASAALGKYNRLDQEDQDAPDWSEIVPQPVEYLNQPEILGIKVENPRALVEKVKRKYQVQDIEYEEVPNG